MSSWLNCASGPMEGCCFPDLMISGMQRRLSSLLIGNRSDTLDGMGRRKKTDAEKNKTAKAIDAKFVGGPKDGTTLQIINPPPEHIRLVAGVKDWCTYEWDTNLRLYRHIGDVRIKELHET